MITNPYLMQELILLYHTNESSKVRVKLNSLKQNFIGGNPSLLFQKKRKENDLSILSLFLSSQITIQVITK